MAVNNIPPKSPFSDFEKPRTQGQLPSKPVEVKQNQQLPQKQNLIEKTPKEEKSFQKIIRKDAIRHFSQKTSKINQSQIETHFDKVFCGFLFKVRNRQATTKTVPACFR